MSISSTRHTSFSVCCEYNLNRHSNHYFSLLTVVKVFTTFKAIDIMSSKMLCLFVAIAAIANLVQGEFDATCARCLCHIQTNCNNNHPAGPYKISWPYWADGGKPTVNGEHPGSETAFQNCLKNEQCNLEAVSGYMRNFEQDCDSDGHIQCIDYIKIHVFGGYGCVGELPLHLQKKYDQCQSGSV